eukprot:7495910-Pyramimonas_sp.AAC.1
MQKGPLATTPAAAAVQRSAGFGRRWRLLRALTRRPSSTSSARGSPRPQRREPPPANAGYTTVQD